MKNMIMALWRLLDKTSGSLAHAVKHPPQTNRTQQNDEPRNRLKSKAAAKIGRRG